jgi:hypothetical protein
VQHRGQGRVQRTQGANDDAGAVDAQRQSVVLLDDPQRVPALIDDRGDAADVVRGQGHVGGLDGHVRAGRADGNPEVGRGQ